MSNLFLPIISGFIFAFLYRYLLKLFKSKNIQIRSKNNIGKSDKILRYIFGFTLLYLGYNSGSYITLFFSGFCFFEAIFSWCGFYALLGKNTCEI